MVAGVLGSPKVLQKQLGGWVNAGPEVSPGSWEELLQKELDLAQGAVFMGITTHWRKMFIVQIPQRS